MSKEKKKNIDILGQIQKLSKRELILIYILVVVAIIAGGVMLLVKPAMDTHSDVSDQLTTLQQEKQKIDNMIDQKPVLQEQITAYKKTIRDLSDQFNEVMVSEDIDALITGMVTSSGLRPVSLTIGENDGQVESQEQSAESSQTQSSGQSSDSSGDSQSSEESQGTEQVQENDVTSPQTQAISTDDSVVKTTVVTVQVKGNMGHFSSLVGRAAAKKGVALRSFALTNQEGDESSSALAEVLNGNNKTKSYPYTAELVFEVYQSSQE